MGQYSGRLEKIEEELAKALPKASGAGWLRARTTDLGAEVPPSMIDRIHAPGWELLSRGGKRWRPLVMVLCCEAAGGQAEMAYPWTPMVEMAHNGSLMVDDIEDASTERRGGPAVHLIHGEDMAINTGTLLMFSPTVLAGQAGPKLGYPLLKAYCDSLWRLHLGQGLDIQWHNDHQSMPGRELYLQMCSFKTGALARFAAYGGCLIGGADEACCSRAAKGWEKVGVGFQILDDVKNLTTGNPGKRRGDDIIEGKKSLPVILYYERYPQDFPALASLMVEAKEGGERKGQAVVGKAIDLLEETIQEASQIGVQILGEARNELESLWGGEGAPQYGLIDDFLKKML